MSAWVPLRGIWTGVSQAYVHGKGRKGHVAVLKRQRGEYDEPTMLPARRTWTFNSVSEI